MILDLQSVKSFNSRTREGCDNLLALLVCNILFQFTHPRGVRCNLQRTPGYLRVSIHAPARGAIRGRSFVDSYRCFNSRTREGCDVSPGPRSSTSRFQFTHPRGVRCWSNARTPYLVVSIHAPARGAINFSLSIMFKYSFNSRTREGCDSTKTSSCLLLLFQFTHPRGVRYFLDDVAKAVAVSIHAPARGAISPSRCGMPN